MGAKNKPYKPKHFRQYISPHKDQNVWLSKLYYYKTDVGYSSWWVDW